MQGSGNVWIMIQIWTHELQLIFSPNAVAEKSEESKLVALEQK